MASAVVISAIALVFQAAMLYGTFRATQTLRDRVVAILPKVEGVLESSRIAIDEGRAGIAEVRQKSNQILDLANKQLGQLEGMLADASERSQRQFAHAEMVVRDLLDRVDETVALVHKGILKPVRGIAGITAGVRAMIQVLLRGNRPRPDRVTVDEEMFI
jgi:hypothetical protein